MVRTDPVPLIKQHDTAHLPPPEPAGPAQPDPGHGPGWLASRWCRFAGDADAGPESYGDHSDRAAYARPHAAGGITATEAFRPARPLEMGRRRRGLAQVAVLIALVVIGVLIYLLVAGGSSRGNAPSASRPTHGATATHHSAGTGPATQAPGRLTGSTSLPPDSSGTYEASIYDVRLLGRF